MKRTRCLLRKLQTFFCDGMGGGKSLANNVKDSLPLRKMTETFPVKEWGGGGKLLAINVKDSLPLKGQRGVDKVEKCK